MKHDMTRPRSTASLAVAAFAIRVSGFSVVLAASFGIAALLPSMALADGFPTDPLPGAGSSTASRSIDPTSRFRVHAPRHPTRDPLAVDAGVAVKDDPAKTIDLPGVLKLEGADRDALDPTRVQRISWTNAGSRTVYVSATQPNRIQLPFANPKIVSTTDVEIDKRPSSNNVYVTFAAGVTHPVQIWLEPVAESSASIGLQLVPKTIPAQAIVVLDDTVDGSSGRSARGTPQNEYLTRVQALLEQAALGASPEGYAAATLELPPISVDGLAVEGLRRLSGRSEDIYVYTVSNPGAADVRVVEREFDGADVLAVSIVPKPLLHAGERAIVAILAKKRDPSPVVSPPRVQPPAQPEAPAPVKPAQGPAAASDQNAGGR